MEITPKWENADLSGNEEVAKSVKVKDGQMSRPEVRVLKQRSILLILALLGAACLQPSAAAQAPPPSHAKVELIADTGGPMGSKVWVGLLFHLDPGWHVYWQNPGDSGTPPKVDWHLPVGYRPGALRWPTPVRLGHGSVVDYAYESEVLLMAPIERSATSTAGGSEQIAADVRYVVCSDVCIQGKAHVTLALPPRDGVQKIATRDASEWHALFQRAGAELPKPAPAAWRLSAASRKDDFVLSVRTGTAVKSAAFFPLDPDEIENSAPQAFAATTDAFRLTLRKSEQLATQVKTLRGLVVLGPQRAYEIAVPVTLFRLGGER